MYLMKAPRLDSVTIQQVWATEEWFGYCKRPNEYRTSSFEEWCGASQDDLPSEKVMEVLRPYYVERFASWDTNHVHPHSDIIQNVAYWRKRTRFTDGSSTTFRTARMTAITTRNARKASSKSC